MLMPMPMRMLSAAVKFMDIVIVISVHLAQLRVDDNEDREEE